MKKTLIAMSIVLSSLSTIAVAAPNEGYLVDSSGKVVKSGTGLCIRTGSWTPANATPECDGGLVKAPVVAPVVAAPVVPVAPVTTPVAPVARTEVKEVLSADLLFGFDKYNLTSEGKEVLTSLVNRNKDMQSAMVIGYADPLGSDSYNKRLSQRRAQTVKAFLVSKGLNANTITTEGRGESKLKVTQADCKGQNLIACYAPNRRVEITIK